MALDKPQTEALEELINVAFSRAAASLSSLIANRILIEAPHVAVHPIAELPAALAEMMPSRIVSVHQLFTGAVSGDAFFVFDAAMARRLAALLSGEADRREPEDGTIDAAASEVLMEVGNILLNACLGVFGNLLDVKVSFSIPQISVINLEGVLSSIHVGPDELRYAMVASTSFRVRESELRGFLVIALGVTSLDQLLAAAARER